MTILLNKNASFYFGVDGHVPLDKVDLVQLRLQFNFSL